MYEGVPCNGDSDTSNIKLKVKFNDVNVACNCLKI